MGEWPESASSVKEEVVPSPLVGHGHGARGPAWPTMEVGTATWLLCPVGPDPFGVAIEPLVLDPSRSMGFLTDNEIERWTTDPWSN